MMIFKRKITHLVLYNDLALGSDMLRSEATSTYLSLPIVYLKHFNLTLPWLIIRSVLLDAVNFSISVEAFSFTQNINPILLDIS